MLDSLSHLAGGLQVALEWDNLVYCFIGALIGTLIGILPGLGPVATIAILMPITFHLEPISALVMLAGIYYGAQYGGSTTAILVNLPGESSSVITCLDGYKMARNGRAGAALSIAAVSSLAAGIFATFLMGMFAVKLVELGMFFGPAEYFSLMMLGLIAAVMLSEGSLITGIAMVLFGIALSLVGNDVSTGTARLTFGYFQLGDGFNFVPVAMGLYAVAEIIRNLEIPEARAVMKGTVGSFWPNREEIRRSVPATVRGTLLGSVLGLLPGGGPTLGSFAAYMLEKRVSKRPEKFGTGIPEGVAAPESANNASAQTSFIPLLTLGLPANPTIAMVAGAMMIQGIQPGPQVMTNNPDLFWGLIASMFVGNTLLVIINLPLIRVWITLLKLPYRFFYQTILVCCCIGAYSVNNSVFDVYVMLGFGLFGYVLLKCSIEPAPLILAFVLGPMVEEYLRRAMLLSQGDPTTFVTRPISLLFILLSIAALLFMLQPHISLLLKRVGPRSCKVPPSSSRPF